MNASKQQFTINVLVIVWVILLGIVKSWFMLHA